MNRLVPISAFLFLVFSGATLAQDANGLPEAGKPFFTADGRQLRSDAEITAYLATMEAEKRQKLESACDAPKASLTHALVELCNWIGQHR
jgi:hypothetical protein